MVFFFFWFLFLFLLIIQLDKHKSFLRKIQLPVLVQKNLLQCNIIFWKQFFFPFKYILNCCKIWYKLNKTIFHWQNRTGFMFIFLYYFIWSKIYWTISLLRRIKTECFCLHEGQQNMNMKSISFNQNFIKLLLLTNWHSRETICTI